MKLCTDCQKRHVCNTLCPEAELYVNQDYVEQSELTESELEFNVNEVNIEVWPEKGENVTQKAKIGFAILQGHTKQEICQVFKITTNNFHVITHRIRKSLQIYNR